MPAYSGRAEEGASVGDVLLWVPRVVFFPVYLVTEFVLRRPLGLLITAAERGRWIEEITEAFTFGPTNNIGIVPTALLDFGFQTSVGVYMFYDDFLSKGNAFRVHAAFGGTDWLRLTVADRIPVDENSYFKLRFEGSQRPDFQFFGIGPESKKENLSKYKAKWLDFSANFFAQVKEGNSFELYNSLRTVGFDAVGNADPTEPGADPAENANLADRVKAGQLSLPPGFDGYTAYRQGLRVTLDSRKPRPAPGTGLRLDLGGEHAIDLRRPGSSRWVRYGAAVGGFLDLTGTNRVVSLSVNTQFADPLDDDGVPFT